MVKGNLVLCWGWADHIVVLGLEPLLHSHASKCPHLCTSSLLLQQSFSVTSNCMVLWDLQDQAYPIVSAHVELMSGFHLLIL